MSIGPNDAVISPCGKYRYALTRRFEMSGRLATFIMLNPSTASAIVDDHTIRKCIGFGKRWGCGSFIVVNLFAVRATKPRDMRAASDPVGPDNSRWVRSAARWATYDVDPKLRGPVVCAWGMHGAYMDQDQTVMGWLDDEGVRPKCLGTTKDGYPRHPLMVGYDAPLVDFDGRRRRR